MEQHLTVIIYRKHILFLTYIVFNFRFILLPLANEYEKLKYENCDDLFLENVMIIFWTKLDR